MKRFLVLSVVSLLLLVSVAKCESEEEPETDVAKEDPARDDLEDLEVGVEDSSTTSRPKRQNYDIYSGGGGGGATSYAMMGGTPGPMPAAAIGGGPGGPIGGGPIGGPIGGGPIGGIGGGSWGWPSWGWDPCDPPPGCPRCPNLYVGHGMNCQNFCFSRKWCLCQWW